MSRSWAGGSTTRWRKLRAHVLLANQAENKGRCVLAIPKVCTGQATQVHHVKGKAHGDDPKDLVACCQPCNGHIGQPGRHNPAPKRVSKW